jgi:hypothetical protein
MSAVVIILLLVLVVGAFAFFKITPQGQAMFCGPQRVGLKFKPSTNKVANSTVKLVNNALDVFQTQNMKCGNLPISQLTSQAKAGMSCVELQAKLMTQVPKIIPESYKKTLTDYVTQISKDVCKSDGTIDMALLDSASTSIGQMFCM